jgi:hypothetical protein
MSTISQILDIHYLGQHPPIWQSGSIQSVGNPDPQADVFILEKEWMSTIS